MKQKKLVSAGITLFAVALGLIWLIPLIWMVGTAFSVPSFHMTLLPTTPFTLDNLKYVWNAIPFGTYYLNTLTLVVCTFAVQFVTSTMAAYALGVMDFKGSALVFAVIFMQIIIPNDVLITPNFMTLSELKLVDTKIGMMLPFMAVPWRYSFFASTLNQSPRLWQRRPRSMEPAHGKPFGRFICPAPSRPICLLLLFPSATTGTITCVL